MTEELPWSDDMWHEFRAICATILDLPRWVTDAIHHAEQSDFRVSKSFVCIKQDYIEFLKEQIQLNLRGREWTNVLQLRMDKLSPLVDVALSQYFAWQQGLIYNIYFDEITKQVLCTEEY